MKDDYIDSTDLNNETNDNQNDNSNENNQNEIQIDLESFVKCQNEIKQKANESKDEIQIDLSKEKESIAIEMNKTLGKTLLLNQNGKENNQIDKSKLKKIERITNCIDCCSMTLLLFGFCCCPCWMMNVICCSKCKFKRTKVFVTLSSVFLYTLLFITLFSFAMLSIIFNS